MTAGLLATDPVAMGPYRLLGRLGGGGMGQVFLAKSPGGRLVAVKVIRPDLAADPEFRARFRREVTAARRVSGMFTAVLVDAETDGPTPWLATAYIPGPALSAAVRDSGPLPLASLVPLAAGLAEALSAIHAAGGHRRGDRRRPRCLARARWHSRDQRGRTGPVACVRFRGHYRRVGARVKGACFESEQAWAGRRVREARAPDAGPGRHDAWCDRVNSARVHGLVRACGYLRPHHQRLCGGIADAAAAHATTQGTLVIGGVYPVDSPVGTCIGVLKVTGAGKITIS